MTIRELYERSLDDGIENYEIGILGDFGNAVTPTYLYCQRDDDNKCLGLVGCHKSTINEDKLYINIDNKPTPLSDFEVLLRTFLKADQNFNLTVQDGYETITMKGMNFPFYHERYVAEDE